MTDTPQERENLREIEGLNQRGGRTLSVVDLIEARTLDLDVAAYLMSVLSRGASVLTAATPGGAGKSTLLANLLAFLPPDVRIQTVARPAESSDEPSNAGRVCHLAHEIGSGHWYGYIWGPQVRTFFELARGGDLIASCLHADTLEEVEGVLLSELQVDEGDFRRIDVVAFMHIDPRQHPARRRVASVYQATPDGHKAVFTWDPGADRFIRTDEPLRDVRGLERWRAFAHCLVASGERMFGRVRKRFLAELAAQQ